MKSKKDNNLKIPVAHGVVLGVKVYRGYAKICDLAKISKADIYDQIKNPIGTQRDLNAKHAKEAYEYVKLRDFAFWPEVFLCVREKKIMKFNPLKKYSEFGLLEINLDTLNKSPNILISRVDGNHRLHYADGLQEGYAAIDKSVSFCLAYDLTLDEEITLFKDINNNQKAMNTSHLDNIEVRLSSKQELKQKSPDLFIAQQLGGDKKSPLYGLVFEGGKKISGVFIPLRNLRSGINNLLSRSSQLPTAISDIDAQYKVIRNFFTALKKWQPQAWSNPRDYITLRGAGLWAICNIGAFVIDRVLIQDKFKPEDMLQILKSGKKFDWSSSGDFKGYSGQGGANEISKKVIRYLFDESKMSSKDLFKKIMAED